MSYGCRSSVRAALAVHVVLLSVLAFPVLGAAQPTPVVSFSGVPAQHFIGEPLTFTLTFDNTSAPSYRTVTWSKQRIEGRSLGIRLRSG